MASMTAPLPAMHQGLAAAGRRLQRPSRSVSVEWIFLKASLLLRASTQESSMLCHCSHVPDVRRRTPDVLNVSPTMLTLQISLGLLRRFHTLTFQGTAWQDRIRVDRRCLQEQTFNQKVRDGGDGQVGTEVGLGRGGVCGGGGQEGAWGCIKVEIACIQKAGARLTNAQSGPGRWFTTGTLADCARAMLMRSSSSGRSRSRHLRLLVPCRCSCHITDIHLLSGCHGRTSRLGLSVWLAAQCCIAAVWLGGRRSRLLLNAWLLRGRRLGSRGCWRHP